MQPLIPRIDPEDDSKFLVSHSRMMHGILTAPVHIGVTFNYLMQCPDFSPLQHQVDTNITLDKIYIESAGGPLAAEVISLDVNGLATSKFEWRAAGGLFNIFKMLLDFDVDVFTLGAKPVRVKVKASLDIKTGTLQTFHVKQDESFPKDWKVVGIVIGAGFMEK